MRGWDRVARGSTEAQVARAGPHVGLQAFGGRYEVPSHLANLHVYTVPTWGRCSQRVQRVWLPSRSAAIQAGQEGESSQGGSSILGPPTPSLSFPPSSLPPSRPPGLLDPVVCTCGPGVTRGRSSGSRGKLFPGQSHLAAGELGCQCDACKREQDACLVVRVSRHFLDCCFIVFTTRSSSGTSEGRNARLDRRTIERTSRDPCHYHLSRPWIWM